MAAAVHLPDDRVRLARWIDARSAARCELLGADGRPARLSIDVGPGDLQAAARRRRASTGRRKDHHQRGKDRQLHRARRDRHDEPRHLSERRAARSRRAIRRRLPFRAAERMEPPPHRAARFGLSLGLVHPGRTFRRQHSRQPAAGAGLRALHQHAQSPDQQLQRVRRRRNDDDGQGAVHRDVRRAVLHDQHGRFGRRVHEPASRRRLPGTDRRRQHPRDLPGCALDRAGRTRRPSADALLHRDESGGLHRSTAGRGERLRTG